jgi:hypothetical protein
VFSLAAERPASSFHFLWPPGDLLGVLDHAARVAARLLRQLGRKSRFRARRAGGGYRGGPCGGGRFNGGGSLRGGDSFHGGGSFRGGDLRGGNLAHLGGEYKAKVVIVYSRVRGSKAVTMVSPQPVARRGKIPGVVAASQVKSS